MNLCEMTYRLIRLRFEFDRICSFGLLYVLNKLSLRFLSLVIFISMFPMTILIHLLGYRRVNVFTDRIGHLAIEPDVVIKMAQLGLTLDRRWIIAEGPNRISNRHLLEHWRKYYIVVSGRISSFIVKSIAQFGLLTFNVTDLIAMEGEHQAYEIYRLWGRRPPLLTLSECDLKELNRLKEELGIPKRAWFVCIHAREPGYSRIDSHLHSYRNSSIDNMEHAIVEIHRRGGFVIRIGDASMKPLSPRPGLVDYAHSKFKSDRGDIILCAGAKFIIGNTSGISLVGTIFGVPCLATNMIPLSTLWFTPSDICMPKLLYDRTASRYLSVADVIDRGLMNASFTELYDRSNIEPVENSKGDILIGVREMFDHLEKSLEDRDIPSELELSFRSHFKVGDFGCKANSRCSNGFLLRHRGQLGL